MRCLESPQGERRALDVRMRIIIISILMADDPDAPRGDLRFRTANRPPGETVGSRQVSSRDLLAGGKELVILHDGRRYYLRVTQNGKLILTA